MLRPTRATLAVGLCLVGVAGVMGRSFGQQPQQDAKVRPAAAANTASVQPPAPGTVSIGSIDMDSVLKNYDKFKVQTENFRAEALARHNDLMKIAGDAKQEQEKLQRYTPGSPDAKKCEDQITQLKARFEAGRENAEREFTQKESEMMATIYSEIATMAKAVAKKRGMTFVVKFSDQMPSATEPNSVMAAMSRTILYADPSVDVSADVTNWLNYYYKASGAPAPKATTTPVPTPGAGPGATTPAARPAARPAPAPAPSGN